jgi:hypothetical protein
MGLDAKSTDPEHFARHPTLVEHIGLPAGLTDF